MYLTARVDYALRAAAEIAAAHTSPACAQSIARAQGISLKFVEQILSALKRGGIVCSRRGSDGGYWLARPAHKITLADVIGAIDEPLAAIHGDPTSIAGRRGSARALRRVWVAVRMSLRNVLDEVTLAHLASGKLPVDVTRLARRRNGAARASAEGDDA